MIKTRGIGHVHFVVSDIARSLLFYQTIFGATEAFRTSDRMIFLALPGTEDLITLHQEPGEDGNIDHIGFRFADRDLDAAVDEIEEAGGRVFERGEHAPGIPYANVEDPDGNVFELS